MKKIINFLGLSEFKLSVNDFFLFLLPVAVWFSYHPLVEFAQTDTMYLEISLSLVVLLVFSATSIPYIWRARREIINKKLSWLVAGFAIWNTISLIWSDNLLRGFLTAGVVWLLCLAFFRIITHPKIKQLLPALFKIFVLSAVVVSIFAWIQMVLDIAGVPMEYSLMCVGCQFEYFGFPRATAFAIEPQFFGSLLLAPILLLMAIAQKTKVSHWHYILTGFLMLTMFITLSRGAIYALAVGVLVLIVVNFKKVKQNLLIVGLSFIYFLLSITAQGIMTVINPEVDEKFSFSVAKSVHHLSLGTIDFRDKVVEVKDSSVIATEPTVEKSTESEKSENVHFDGYVAESTDARLSFNELAYDAWKVSISTMFFGVGLGDSGIAMHETHPDQIGKLEITQNEYTEIPLELGLVGLVIFLTILILFFYVTRQNKWAWAIATAFMAQWMFFSGYPNAVHIYLTLFLIVAFSEKQLNKTENLIENYQIFGKIA